MHQAFLHPGSNAKIGLGFAFITWLATLCTTSGCAQPTTATKAPAAPVFRIPPIREQEDWRATDFFSAQAPLEICAAISSHDDASLKQLLAARVDVNVRGSGGFTLLHWALAENNLKAFEELLKQGANPDLVLTSTIHGVAFYKGDSIIFTSMRSWYSKFSVVALSYSKDVNQRRGPDNLLHVFFQAGGSSQKMLGELIAAGIDVNAVGSFGYTPCHYAAYKRPELCIPLLEAGANPDIRDNEGRDILAALELARAQDSRVKQDVKDAIARLKGRANEASTQPE
jgi:ankyrin repeat protein